MADPQIEAALELVCDAETILCAQITSHRQALAVIASAKKVVTEAKEVLQEICDPTSGP